MTVDPLRPELRRSGPTDLTDVGEDTGLLARIGDEIGRHGPMPFARFMEIALYDPDGGYYRAADARPGRGGDFITAPELHPIFGETLAAGIVETWQRLGEPDPFIVSEHGAGDGALAVPLLRAAAAVDARLARALRFRPVEVDRRRIEALRARLVEAGLDGHLDPVGTDLAPFDGIVLANEVLDALPVHRIRRREDGLRELAVDVGPDGTLVETEIEPSTPAIAERLEAEGIELAVGQTAEVCLAIDGWIAAAAAPIHRGLLLLIDYGAPAAELYDPVRRRDGTLRAYVRHQVHDDPYRHVGRQDLTAHVDVTAVERAAQAAGLTTVGITTQAEALVGLGIERRLQAIQADPTTTLEAYTLVRAALLRLLDPAAMGRFRVMAFGRGWPDADDVPPLGLFSFRLPGRGLRGPR
jgi:SAM-dependent MidA family methyltransferase